MTAKLRAVRSLPPVVESGYELSSQTIALLRLFSEREYPYEACGIIHADGSVTSLANVFHGDRRCNFEMEVDFEAGVPAFAIWHSHPGGRDFLSDSDHKNMHEMYQAGMELPWVIVAADGEITIWELEA